MKKQECPGTDAVWSTLSADALDSIAEWDAERLAIERSRVAPRIREKIRTPLYSVRNMVASWELLILRMESGWQLEGQYPISAYSNDLDTRDNLQLALDKLSSEARTTLGEFLDSLDDRFMAQTVPDDERELWPWLRPTVGDEEAPSERRLRKPVNHPW